MPNASNGWQLIKHLLWEYILKLLQQRNSQTRKRLVSFIKIKIRLFIDKKNHRAICEESPLNLTFSCIETHFCLSFSLCRLSFFFLSWLHSFLFTLNHLSTFFFTLSFLLIFTLTLSFLLNLFFTLSFVITLIFTLSFFITLIFTLSFLNNLTF